MLRTYGRVHTTVWLGEACTDDTNDNARRTKHLVDKTTKMKNNRFYLNNLFNYFFALCIN